MNSVCISLIRWDCIIFKPFVLIFSTSLKYEPVKRILLEKGSFALKTIMLYSLNKVEIYFHEFEG